MNTSSDHQEADTHQALMMSLRTAASAQQWDQAEAIAQQCILTGDPSLVFIGIEVLFARERWDTVLDKLAQVSDKLGQSLQSEADLNIRLLFHFARNMLSCRQHKPDVYERVKLAPRAIPYAPGGRFQIIMAPAQNDVLTIVDHQAASRGGTQAQVILSQGGDPLQMLRAALSAVSKVFEKQGPLGVLSVGDGYLINALGGVEMPGQLKQTSAIHIFEPEPALLAACFMVHDYTGPLGPIERDHYFWYVGSDWGSQFDLAVRSNNKLPPPSAQLKLHPVAADLESEIASHLKVNAGRFTETKQRVHDYYASVSKAEVIARIEGRGDRKPRVLLPTSRFTTVLKYAAMKIERAFQSLGWETRLFLESHDYERCSLQTISSEIDDFKPDLLFLLDHVRSETPEIYPQQLAIASWLQDHLPHLTTKQVGQAVGEMDFILSFAPSLFVGSYDYPARQVIDMPMMVTEEKDVPENWFTAPGNHQQSEDFSYISHVSGEPSALLDDLQQKAPAQLQEVVHKLGQHVINVYEKGGALPTYFHLKSAVMAAAKIHDLSLTDELTNKMVEALWNPLNSALYRQQALEWVADLADRDGLSLGIYGNGWENHPRFGKYARGPIEPGEPLAALSRNTRINLNLEPYACFSHNRLLDGLMAGGFFVVRDHPTNTLMQQLVNFLHVHTPDLMQVEDAEQVRSVIAENKLAEFETLVSEAACITMAHEADPVRQLVSWVRTGVVTPQPEALPYLKAISFSDRSSLEELVTGYLKEAEQRLLISKSQRDSIKDRLTFKACIQRTSDQILSRLKGEI